MRDNILRVAFKGKTEITTSALYQYDYGQILKFIDIDLPANYEVHFSNFAKGAAITNIGNLNGVAIPDSLLQTGLPIYSWIYLHTGLNDGETEYHLTIPVNKRAQPSNEEPTQVQQDSITQTLAALASAQGAIASQLEEVAFQAESARQARSTTLRYLEAVDEYKTATESAWNQIKDSTQLGFITIGSTQLTEENLQKLLLLIEEE